MAATVYDQLAYAAQAAMAEKEPSEAARKAKIRMAFAQFGHPEALAMLRDALEPDTEPTKGKRQEG